MSNAVTDSTAIDLKIVREEGVTGDEMLQQLREFTSRKHVREGLSCEDHAHLQCLQQKLEQNLLIKKEV